MSPLEGKENSPREEDYQDESNAFAQQALLQTALKKAELSRQIKADELEHALSALKRRQVGGLA